jgi:hypothetical protein
MAVHTFDQDAFCKSFPALASVPADQLAVYFQDATTFLGDNDTCILRGAVMDRALNLLTAHLAQSAAMLLAGQTSVAPINGATQGSVSVQMQPPPTTSGWQFWLASTPYGLQLWALLSMRTAGGFLVGGSLERASYRKAGGVF